MNGELWSYLSLTFIMFAFGLCIVGRMFNYASPAGLLYLVAAYGAAFSFFSSPGPVEGWKHNLVAFWIIVGLVTLTWAAATQQRIVISRTAGVISLFFQPFVWWLVITGV